MANVDVQICSAALNLLGAKEISSLTQDADRARICNRVYPGLRDGILSAHPWGFAMKKAALTLESGSPASEWEYQHIIPSDAISGRLWAVFDTNANGARPVKRWETYNGRILSNYQSLWADYIYRPEGSAYPAAFKKLLEYAVCADIAYAITDQQNVALYWHEKAYGTPSEGGMGGQMAVALGMEAQTQGSTGIEADAFVDARLGAY